MSVSEDEFEALFALASAVSRTAVPKRPHQSRCGSSEATLLRSSVWWTARQLRGLAQARSRTFSRLRKIDSVYIHDHSDRQFERQILRNEFAAFPIHVRRHSSVRAVVGALKCVFRRRSRLSAISDGRPRTVIATLDGLRAFGECEKLIDSRNNRPSAVVLSGDMNPTRLALALMAARHEVPIVLILHDHDSHWRFGNKWLSAFPVQCAVIHDVSNVSDWSIRPSSLCVLPFDEPVAKELGHLESGMVAGVVVDARVNPDQCLKLASELLALSGVNHVLLRPHPKPKLRHWPRDLPERVAYVSSDVGVESLASQIDFAVASGTSAVHVLQRRAVPCFSWTSFYEGSRYADAGLGVPDLPPVPSEGEMGLAAIVARLSRDLLAGGTSLTGAESDSKRAEPMLSVDELLDSIGLQGAQGSN